MPSHEKLFKYWVRQIEKVIGEKLQFNRVLGFWHVLSLVIGSMIGTGIFLFSAPVVASLGHPASILLAWVIGSFIALCGAVTLGELASAYPVTGGTFVYMQLAYGSRLGFVYAWTKFLFLGVGSIAILALSFSNFMNDFLSVSDPAAGELQKPIAVVIILLFTLVNILGVRMSARLQNFLTIPKVLCLIGITVLGAYQGFHSNEKVLSSIFDFQWGKICIDYQCLKNYLFALVPILWALGGWDEPTYISAEIKNPEKIVPLAMLIGLIVVSILYFCVQVAYLSVLSMDEISSSPNTVVHFMNAVAGGFSGRIAALFLMITTLGVLNASILTGARVAYAMGREHVFFKIFATIHPATKTPQRALLAQCLLAIAIIFVFDDIYTLLLWTAIPFWFFSCLMAGSLFILKNKLPSPYFRSPFYPFPTLLYIVASVLMLVNLITVSLSNFMVSLTIMSVGLFLYYIQNRFFDAHER